MRNEEKVEFFNSQSSFDSQSSLSSSRYFDLTNQLAEQTQTILMTLRKQLLPTKQLTNFDKVEYLQNRAKIICNDTIPDHLEYLDRISSPKQSQDICSKCSIRLKKFIDDFQSLKKGTMLHKQFYNIYGRSDQNNVFFKRSKIKQQNGNPNQMLCPDVENIDSPPSNYAKDFRRHKNAPRGLAVSAVNPQDKQIRELQQQIARMRKRQNDAKKQFAYQLTSQKVICQKRIMQFLKSLDSSGNFRLKEPDLSRMNSYKNQLTRVQGQLQTSLNENKSLLRGTNQLECRLKEVIDANQSFKEELAGYRKLQSSRMQDVDMLDRSFQSEQLLQQDSSLSLRRLNIKIKKLTSQRDILRNQLTKQRQNVQNQKHRSHQDKSTETTRLKSHLQTLSKQNQEIRSQFDKVRVQLIQLKVQNKSLHKAVSTTKQNNQQLKLRASQFNDSGNMQLNAENRSTDMNMANFRKSRAQSSNGLESSLFNSGSNGKLNSFTEYQGEGIQGYPYYDLLSKQFRVRFRRACLKNKQLLYKGNGLEIGVITQFMHPNIIKVLVHVTNSSQFDIKKLKVKAINPSQNKVQYEIEQVKILQPNQQVKIPVTCTIRNYPIGPVVLILDYFGQTKHDMRLLLPVHIFKCVDIEPRAQYFLKPTKLIIKSQNKISKDLTSLKQYMNCEQQNQIKLKITHSHSDSVMFLNVTMVRQNIQIEYQHVKGYQYFTQYFVKTFKMLLQKSN